MYGEGRYIYITGNGGFYKWLLELEIPKRFYFRADFIEAFGEVFIAAVDVVDIAQNGDAFGGKHGD